MLTIRPAETDDAPAIAKVHVDTWRAAYRSIIPQDYLDTLTVQNRTIGWVRLLERGGKDLITLVSEDNDGRIVGFASGGRIRHREPRFEAEISSLYISPRVQRSDHGRRLFLSLSNRLAQRNLKGLFVWVLADNPARTFYEALGGREVSEITRDFAGVPLREVGYGWAETPSYE
ncbi:MAG: GNAT family N-acetyltransferase [Rhodospirillaceae bacterium]|nr:GNAT family N-acetyltransferase [Rhodospirillaceae bacterium]